MKMKMKMRMKMKMKMKMNMKMKMKIMFKQSHFWTFGHPQSPRKVARKMMNPLIL